MTVPAAGAAAAVLAMHRIDLGPCEGLLHDGSAERCVVILPGMRYSTQAPLLWFARETALQQGFGVLEVLDALPDGADGAGWAQDRARRALDAVGDAGAGADVAVVGKSLASCAAGVVADRDLAAVWLTPLTGHAAVADALGRAARPTLLIGGTADPAWAPEALPQNPMLELLALEGLDHGLQRPGDLEASFDALWTVTDRIDRFLRAVAAR